MDIKKIWSRETFMKVSIIIPIYNGEKYLKRLLDAIVQQSINFHELIIVDSSSKDNSVEIAKEYTDKVFIIPSNEFDHGGTRAKIANIATGDILVYFTQDALPADSYCLENLVKIFENANVAAAYGKQLSYPDTNLFGQHLRQFNYPDKEEYRGIHNIEKYGIKTAQLSNSFSAYRKKSLIDIGNFKSNLILGEDVYAGAKLILANYTLAYVPNAKVFHSHSYTIFEDFKRYFDIGVFHKTENWIIQHFGKAEGEGMKYIKSELIFLRKENSIHLIFEWFFRNVMKYIGYKLGFNYTWLPKELVKKCSMHSNWWKKNEQK